MVWDSDGVVDTGVALYNAGEEGLAFLSTDEYHVGNRLLLKLFRHDSNSPDIPAVVRYARETAHGFLVGCRFLVEHNDDARSPSDTPTRRSH